MWTALSQFYARSVSSNGCGGDEMSKRIIQNRFESAHDFRTAPEVFDALNRRFGPFSLDAAASRENNLCFAYFDESRSALERKWFGRVWLNPPYNDIKPWAEYAIDQVARGYVQSVTLLLPAGTCTQWFKSLWEHWSCKRIIFITGRLKFGGPHSHKDKKKANATNPSVVFHLDAGEPMPQHPTIERIDREMI